MPTCTDNRCSVCYIIETSLGVYLHTAAGRSFVRQALHKATIDAEAVVEEEKIVMYLLESTDALQSKIKELTRQRDECVGQLYVSVLNDQIDLIEKALARK